MLRFFSEPAVEHAIAYLASAEDLTVFVGAGASKEVGLPTWQELVKGLLDRAITSRRWDSDRGWLVEQLLGHGDLLGAAERIQLLLGEDALGRAIYELLYGADPPAAIEPGALAMGVAEMRAAFAEALTIATTNYDQLLVTALRRTGVGAARSYCTNSNRVGVVHLHGVLGYEEPADGVNEVVLTERSYLAPLAAGWRRDFMQIQLGRPCLFLGASLTDLNLLTSLHAQRPIRGVRHYVVFVRPDATSAEEVRRRRRLESLERRRWRELNVEPLFADTYADVAQFAFELALRRREPDAETVPTRFDRWYSRRETRVFSTGPIAYPRRQRELATTLAAALVEIRRLLRLTDPVMSLSVCALFPPETGGQHERPIIWATSDRAMTTPDTLEFLELISTSRWTVIKALRAGWHRAEPKAVYASRWRYVWAEPIFQSPPSRLPVGAVMLSTTSGENETTLPVGPGAGASARRVSSLRSTLTRIGEAVLLADR
jgi:hypothetical protein